MKKRLRQPIRIVAALAILVVVVITNWLYWTHPDMTQARLFLTFWPIEVPAIVVALLAIGAYWWSQP